MERNYPDNDIANIYAANMTPVRRMKSKSIEQQISYDGGMQARRGSRGMVIDSQTTSPEVFPIMSPSSSNGSLEQRRVNGPLEQRNSKVPLEQRRSNELEQRNSNNGNNNNGIGSSVDRPVTV